MAASAAPRKPPATAVAAAPDLDDVVVAGPGVLVGTVPLVFGVGVGDAVELRQTTVSGTVTPLAPVQINLA